MTEATSAKKVGYMMKDGTIFAGISPHTKQPMYAAPADAPVKMDFITAAKYAKKLKIGGKKGFRVPTKKELQVLFDNRKEGALKGTFNLTSSNLAGYYWSSIPDDFCAYGLCFGNGGEINIGQREDLSVRCVR